MCTTPHANVPYFFGKKPFKLFSNDQNRSQHFRIIWAQRKRVKYLRVSLPPNLVLQSVSLDRPKGFQTVSEWPKSVKAFSRHKKVGRPVGRLMGRPGTQTRARTGLVVNHCAAAMVLKGKSRFAWVGTPNKWNANAVDVRLRHHEMIFVNVSLGNY